MLDKNKRTAMCNTDKGCRVTGAIKRQRYAWLLVGAMVQSGAHAAASVSTFDFMASEAPFRTDFHLGEHPAFLQLYGVIDLTLTHTNHTLPANHALPNNVYSYAGTRIVSGARGRTVWVNGGLQDSRFGLRGEVAALQLFSQPYRVVYQLEGGFNPLDMQLNDAAQTLADNSGTQSNHSVSSDSSLNGEWFGRQAWVGLESDHDGRLSYGTQYNPFFEIFAAYDPNNKADTFSPFGESGTVGGGGGISENARMKHTLRYGFRHALNSADTVNLAVSYQDGNAANTHHGHGTTAQLGLETPAFGAQLAYNAFVDAIKAGLAGVGNPLANDTISANLFNTEAALLALRWNPTPALRLSGGWEWYQLKPSSSARLNVSHLFGQTLFGGVATSGLATGYTQHNHVYFIGANYDWSQSFPVLNGFTTSVGYYLTAFDAIKGPTVSTNSQGRIDTWTMIADYRWNRRFDSYLALTSNHFSGDRYPSQMFYQNVSTVGAGLRLRF